MVGQAATEQSRYRELWNRLERVNDPELDEPVTEMGFVERADVFADGSVEVDFRLPTYWCSPNFAFLMLDGLRQALDGLSWSPAYRIRLHDHMFAEEVNRGIEAGRSFGQIFDDLAGDEDIDALRETFARKAFMRRQEAVLLGFRQQGLTDFEVVDMDLGAYEVARLVGEAAMQKPRYREALLLRRPGLSRVDPVFVTWEGEAIPPDGLSAHLADLRSVRINMEFNGALCRGLKASRYKQVEMVEGEPTLVDFILDRVPSGDGGRQAAHG